MAGMNPVRLQQLLGWVTSALEQSPATPETWLQTVCTDDAALAEARFTPSPGRDRAYNLAMFGARAVVIATTLLVTSALAGVEPGGSVAPRSIVRHFTPADRVSGRYQYVPFDVPAGTGTLRVSYQYDRANGNNVVDLGLFEPGSLEIGTRAFRGYSGGAKAAVTISAADTSAGYRPGPLPAGQWHALLGLYKVDEGGVTVTVTVETQVGANASEPPMVRLKPDATSRPDGARWLMGALHMHTLHSDGTVSPAELMRQARDAGFDFVAITDHNNTTHTYDPALGNLDQPLWIVGEEVTTPGGHANVWGLKAGDWVDFRIAPEDRRIHELVGAARRLGGLFSINHPVSECAGCGWSHEVVDGIEGVEISNGRHGEVDKALAFWDKLLITGRRITGVGSSDWHAAPNPIDVANVRVYADTLTQEAILSAIRNGRVIVMGRARDETPEIVVRAGDQAARSGGLLTVAAGTPMVVEINAASLKGRHGTLVAVSNGVPGAAVSLDESGQLTLRQRANPGYLRFELYAEDGSLFAATNPVYLVRP